MYPRGREHQRAHGLHRILDEYPRMALLDLILPITVHANDAVVYRALTLTFRDYRRLFDETEILLLYHCRRGNHRLLYVFYHRRLLLDRGEKALLLLLLCLGIRYEMSHLKIWTRDLQSHDIITQLAIIAYLFVPIDVMRIPTSLAFAIDAGFRVDVARTALTAAGQFTRCCCSISATTPTSLWRIVWIRGSGRGWWSCDHIRCRNWCCWLIMSLKSCGNLHWRPLETCIWVVSL